MKTILRLFILFTLFACNNDDPTDTPAPQKESIKILALGDSYTIGQSVPIPDRWPIQLADSLEKRGFKVNETTIIAQTGWTTANLQTGIDNNNPANDYDLVGLLIGVNNEFQGRPLSEYAIQFELLLQQAIGFANGDTSRVFVLSIPDYGVTPFGGCDPDISAAIDTFNYTNQNITAQYNVNYYDITPISRMAKTDGSLLAPDNLHPSGKMYKLWVDLIFNAIFNSLTD